MLQLAHERGHIKQLAFHVTDFLEDLSLIVFQSLGLIGLLSSENAESLLFVVKHVAIIVEVLVFSLHILVPHRELGRLVEQL